MTTESAAPAWDGYAVVSADALSEHVPGAAWEELRREWDRLEVDEYLPGPVKYRARRYGRLLARMTDAGGPEVSRLPDRAFVQDAEHIPIYGGRPREFAPLTDAAASNPALHALVSFDAAWLGRLRPDVEAWEVGVHMVRLTVAAGGAVSPTPEGRHRDGHAFVGMHLAGRRGCEGAATTVFDRAGDRLTTVTLTRPLDCVLVDDEAVEHEVSDLVGDPGSDGGGHRDVLILAFDHPNSGEHVR